MRCPEAVEVCYSLLKDMTVQEYVFESVVRIIVFVLMAPAAVLHHVISTPNWN